MVFVPNAEEALTELRELVRLGADDVNVAEAFRCLVDDGAPFLTAHVDALPAISTDDRIVRYKLAEPLKVRLAALRAGHFKPDDVDEIECHGASLCLP